MSKVVIPNTQEEAIHLLDKRRQHHQARTMYDMLLIGLAYCSEKEFNDYMLNNEREISCRQCCEWCSLCGFEYNGHNVTCTDGINNYINGLDEVKFNEFRKER